MPTITLTYFDSSSSRGEECRLALHAAGVAFTDRRIARGEWPALKPTTPFGSLPILEVEGVGVLAQSNAILTWIGRTWALHPTDLWQAAQHEALMCAAEDLRALVAPSMRMTDLDERKRAREKLATDALPRWGAMVERRIDPSPFLAGERLQVADIKLYVLLDAYRRGVLDDIPTDVFRPFERLGALVDAVAAHERIVSWQSATR